MSIAADEGRASDLVDGRFGILDLVDIEQLRGLFEQFSAATGFTIGFLDHPQMNILVETGWKSICTRFHRGHPVSEALCKYSNHRLLDDMNEPGVVVVDRCENGLVDCAVPIVIEGKHIASLSTGQMLLQKPDVELFRRQALAFGFDEEAYLLALSEVEVVDEQKLKSATGFLGSMAQLITQSGYAKLKAEKEIEERKLAEAARFDAEERFRLIFETSREAIVFGWPDGRIDTANEEAYRLFGFSRDELRSGGRKTIIDVSDPQLAVALVVRQRLGSFRCELSCRHKDGSVFPAEVVSTIFLDGNGEARSSTMFRDIKERYEKERVLHETIRALGVRDQALGAIFQGVLITGSNRLITYVNDAFTWMTGYSASEVAGLPCSILQGAETSVATVHSMRAALDAAQPFHGEILNYRKDGTPFWNDLSITPVFDELGALSLFVGVQRDISARKTAELALRESRGLISTFFDSLDDMVAVIDENGAILAINRAWRNVAQNHGAPQALIDAIGVNYLSVCELAQTADADVAEATNGIKSVLSGQRPRFELEYACHSPTVQRFFKMRVFPLSGPRVGALIIHEDITDKKRIEQERTRDSLKLTALSRRLVAVQEENRRRLARELHDRTSPNLAAISINLDVAELALRDKDWQAISLRMSDNRGLIEDTAVSIREICADLRSPALDYAGLVPAMESYATQFAWRTAIVVKLDCPDAERRIAPELESILFRIFQEAMTNITKHAEATSVTVSLAFDAQHIRLAIADNGRGFNTEKLEFSPGQGLINMREMAEFSGGTITFQSGIGCGTRILVTI